MLSDSQSSSTAFNNISLIKDIRGLKLKLIDSNIEIVKQISTPKCHAVSGISKTTFHKILQYILLYIFILGGRIRRLDSEQHCTRQYLVQGWTHCGWSISPKQDWHLPCLLLRFRLEFSFLLWNKFLKFSNQLRKKICFFSVFAIF